MKNDIRNLFNFHPSNCKSENLHFDGILLFKVGNVWALNLQRSYLSSQWRMMKNLKRNWLVVSKLTPQFDKFWPKHLNVSKICILKGCFWPKYIMFELKCTEELCLMSLKIDVKFEGKLTYPFQNDMTNLAKFHRLKNSDFI